MPVPLLSEVVDALLKLVLPTRCVSLAVMLATRRWAGPHWAAVGAAVALAAGVLAGNFFREANPWRIDSDRPLTFVDLLSAAAGGLEKRPAADGWNRWLLAAVAPGVVAVFAVALAARAA